MGTATGSCPHQTKLSPEALPGGEVGASGLMFWIARAGGQKVTIQTVQREEGRTVPGFRKIFCGRGSRRGTDGVALDPETGKACPLRSFPGDPKGKMMKREAILLGCALAAAGCSMSGQEEALENSIRENLGSRGEVKQVEMTKQDADRMNGFAVVRASGAPADSRLDCTATRDPAKGASYYNWRCVPAIDEALLTQMEGTIRQALAAQASVQEVEMTKQDANRMTGFATLQDPAGNEIRTNCTATRDNDDQGNFSWECQAADGSGGAAPAEGEEQ